MTRIREGYVNQNQGADWPKAKRWNVGRLYFDHDDPASAVTPANTGHVGVKMNGASAAIAQAMSDYLRDHGFGSSTTPSSCAAMFDPEPFHPSDVIELLHAWRAIRRTRYTIVTIPPWQAGLFTPELAQLINDDPNLLLAVQDYMSYAGDDLYPAYSIAAENELVDVAKITRARITHFLSVKSYAGAGVEIPYGWAGLLWEFDTLPAAPPAPL